MTQETLSNQNQTQGHLRGPDFVGDGIAAWINQDKNGKDYLSVKLFGQIRVACFKPEPYTNENKY